MPTASTAQILGNNESFEPYTSNIYSRRVLSGEFQVVNKHLLKDLTALNLWDENMKNTLIAHKGSVQVCLLLLLQPQCYANMSVFIKTFFRILMEFLTISKCYTKLPGKLSRKF